MKFKVGDLLIRKSEALDLGINKATRLIVECCDFGTESFYRCLTGDADIISLTCVYVDDAYKSYQEIT